MKIEQKRDFIINFIFTCIIIGLVFFTINVVLGYVMPFLIGFIIALVIRPIVLFLHRKLSINSRVLSVVVLILFYTIIGTIITLGTLYLVHSLSDLFSELPHFYENTLEPLITDYMEQLTSIIERFDPSFLEILDNVGTNFINNLGNMVNSISKVALEKLTNVIYSVPSTILSVLFTIISSFFISIDFNKVTGFLRGFLDDRTNVIISAVKNVFSKTIFKLAKAYALIMFITFIELSIGFMIIKIPNAFGLAILIALIDILPVLGTGGVMIPWFLIELFSGNITLGISLLVLYLIITVIRNMIEPKIVGDQIGVYPLATLFSMYVGTKLFGVLGLFGFPISLAIINKLEEEGIVTVFRRKKIQKEVSVDEK